MSWTLTDRVPHPGRELEIEFNNKIGQTVVVRQRDSLGRCTHQQLVYSQLACFIPSSFYFGMIAPLESTSFPPLLPPPHLIPQPWEQLSEVAPFALVGKPGTSSCHYFSAPCQNLVLMVISP